MIFYFVLYIFETYDHIKYKLDDYKYLIKYSIGLNTSRFTIYKNIKNDNLKKPWPDKVANTQH